MFKCFLVLNAKTYSAVVVNYYGNESACSVVDRERRTDAFELFFNSFLRISPFAVAHCIN